VPLIPAQTFALSQPSIDKTIGSYPTFRRPLMSNSLVIGILVLLTLPCGAQQNASSLPDAPAPQPAIPVPPSYTPPTQQERFRSYVRHTYSLYSVVEAGVRGGIDQGLDRPSQWPEGAQGYADRFGSAMGEIVVRGTTEYLVADAFREDIRFVPCASPCSESKLTRAAEDTFTARKGNDGHRVFSVARLAGPIAASVVMKETWFPGGYSDTEIIREAAFNYTFSFFRNYLRELSH
jgi:hypothetical protein